MICFVVEYKLSENTNPLQILGDLGAFFVKGL